MALPPPAARQAKAPYSPSCRNVTKCYKEPRYSGPSTKARISIEAKPKKRNKPNPTLVFNKHSNGSQTPRARSGTHSRIPKATKVDEMQPLPAFSTHPLSPGRAKLARQIDAQIDIGRGSVAWRPHRDLNQVTSLVDIPREKEPGTACGTNLRTTARLPAPLPHPL
jgi:hypothetical protein